MPELPEVETTCRGIRPHLEGCVIASVHVRERRLRWEVPAEIDAIRGIRIHSVNRRAKYILVRTQSGTLIIHLGMSGSLRICQPETAHRPHDHIILSLDSGIELRYHDPRRFGCWLWEEADPQAHPLLANLGPEPLGEQFNADYLAGKCHGRSAAIKQVIMNSQVVVGVGNIYACEALFACGIHPRRRAGNISRARLSLLVEAIREVLDKSIRQGGTTLRDFLREDGQPGYFKQRLRVYDRENQPCRNCGTPIKRINLGQRSTFYCPECQH